MDKDVLIHVRGLQMMDAEDEQEPIEIVVPGEYYFRNGSHYLRFEEVLDDSAEPTVNYIKMSPKGLEVRKKGLVNVHMVFEQGKKNMTYYSIVIKYCAAYRYFFLMSIHVRIVEFIGDIANMWLLFFRYFYIECRFAPLKCRFALL